MKIELVLISDGSYSAYAIQDFIICPREEMSIGIKNYLKKHKGFDEEDIVVNEVGRPHHIFMMTNGEYEFED